MIKKVEMFTIVCDNCKVDIGADDEYSCWNDELSAESNAMEMGLEKHGDNHYCLDCINTNDDDELILDESRKDKFEVK